MKNKLQGIKMKINFWGIKSISFIIIALLIGAYSIIINNLLFGVIYLMLIPASFLLISYSYCTKCPCRLSNCGHYILGQLTRLFSARKDAKYNFFDYMGMVLPFLFLIVLPQYYLLKNIIMLIIFWILFFVAAVEILFFVCKSCDNYKCAMCSTNR